MLRMKAVVEIDLSQSVHELNTFKLWALFLSIVKKLKK